MAELKGYTQLKRRFAAISSEDGRRNFMKALALAAVREQKLRVRRRTGTTGRTIRVEHVSPNSAVTSAGGAAVFLEGGTRPHDITPKARKALRFAASSAGARLSGAPRVGAAVVFAARVHHPGTKPAPFMMPGALAALAKQDALAPLVERWNKAS